MAPHPLGDVARPPRHPREPPSPGPLRGQALRAGGTIPRMARNPLEDVAGALRNLGERLSQGGGGDPADWLSDQLDSLRRQEPARTLPELQAELDRLIGLETV